MSNILFEVENSNQQHSPTAKAVEGNGMRLSLHKKTDLWKLPKPILVSVRNIEFLQSRVTVNSQAVQLPATAINPAILSDL